MVATDIVPDPWMVELVMTLPVAPSMKRMVLVPEVAETVVFAIVSALPPVFRPSMVTLSAPFRSIRGEPAAIAPVIVRGAPPVGLISTEL